MNSVDVAPHNEAVAKLNAAYGRRGNERVPIRMTWDESLWLNLTGRTFREFYTDAKAQLDVTIEGMAWCAENIVHDGRLGLPDEWTLAPRWWMDEPECLGCEVTIQEHDFAWSTPRKDAKGDLLRSVRDFDPREAVRASRLFGLYSEMRELAEGLTYRERPVRIISPGGTHGIFTIAARVRGEQQLCLDLYEDPDSAYEFIGAITDHTIGRIEAWHELAETGTEGPSPSGWGLPDDSLQMLSPAMYREFVLPHHERIYGHFTTGFRSMHLCGFAEQHYETLYHELGIRALNGPGPWIDYGRVLAELPELSMAAQTDHTLLITGPAEEIDAMMRGMLTDGSKQPGRFSIDAFMIPDTPLEHVRAVYEAGVKYGRIT